MIRILFPVITTLTLKLASLTNTVIKYEKQKTMVTVSLLQTVKAVKAVKAVKHILKVTIIMKHWLQRVLVSILMRLQVKHIESLVFRFVELATFMSQNRDKRGPRLCRRRRRHHQRQH